MIKKTCSIALALILIPTIGCTSAHDANGASGNWENSDTQIVMPKSSEEPKSSEPIFADSYEEALKISKDKPLLVVLGTDWCGYCVKLKNEIRNFDLTNYVICFVDADERKDLAKSFQVRSYPTSFILKNEVIKSKKKGYRKSDYSNWINQNR